MTLRDFLPTFGVSGPVDAGLGAPSRARVWRTPLAMKFATALIGLVVLVLLVNGAINTWLAYDQVRRAALAVEEEKATSAAAQVGEFLTGIVNQLGWTTGAEWRHAQSAQQRYDFVRLLRQVPAITELSYLDGQGREQVQVSRLGTDSIGSNRDFSKEPRFVKAVADKIWFGPVEFRSGSEPYMTIAVAHVGRDAGVTVADVNLKLIWDVISAIRVGEKGYAFVVGRDGHLIAHPDLSLVLRETDFSGLPQVRQALGAAVADEPAEGALTAPRVGLAEIAKAYDGGDVLTAYAIVPKTHWTVFVQQPLAEALAPVYRSLWQTLALLGLGLLLALVVGGLLARRMAVPIDRLRQGAEQLGAGDLSQRIDIHTGDEIETLADQFNQMAGRIQESYETLEAKVEARTRDLNEALQQQTATAEVLKVISRSAFDLQAVLDTLIGSAVELSGANWGAIYLRDGEVFRWLAASGADPDYVEYMRSHPRAAGRGTVVGRVALSGRVECIPDMLEDKEFDLPASVLARGRGVLGVPLLRDGKVEGAIVLTRYAPGPYSQRQIDLVQTFADQAVIAIENVRLFDEVQARTRDLSEALQQQTATADVLKVISRSVFDLRFGVRHADRHPPSACAGQSGHDLHPRRRRSRASAFIATFLAALREYLADDDLAARTGTPTRPERPAKDGSCTSPTSRRSEDEARRRSESARPTARGYRVPLIGERQTIGVFGVPRDEPVAFTDREIELVKTFADQAVIAIENVRLFDEVQARTKDLSEALQQQTATAEVLKVISRSAFDLQAVFDTLIASAVELFGASRRHDLHVAMVTVSAQSPSRRRSGTRREFLADAPTAGRRIGDRRACLLSGRRRSTSLTSWQTGNMRCPRTRAIGRGRRLPCHCCATTGSIGVFVLARSEPGAFTQRQIDIVQTFADQAVIAIENVRLFDEVQARTRDLSEALQLQTATSDVLKVISRSAFDLQAVFDTLTASAVELCGAFSGSICVRDGEVYRYRGNAGPGSACHEPISGGASRNAGARADRRPRASVGQGGAHSRSS